MSPCKVYIRVVSFNITLEAEIYAKRHFLLSLSGCEFRKTCKWNARSSCDKLDYSVNVKKSFASLIKLPTVIWSNCILFQSVKLITLRIQAHSKSLLKMKLVKRNWAENVHVISEMVSLLSSYVLDLLKRLICSDSANSWDRYFVSYIQIGRCTIQLHKNHLTTWRFFLTSFGL